MAEAFTLPSVEGMFNVEKYNVPEFGNYAVGKSLDVPGRGSDLTPYSGNYSTAPKFEYKV